MKVSGLLDQEKIQERDKLTELAFGKNVEYYWSVGSEAMMYQRFFLGLCNKIYRERGGG